MTEYQKGYAWAVQELNNGTPLSDVEDQAYSLDRTDFDRGAEAACAERARILEKVS